MLKMMLSVIEITFAIHSSHICDTDITKIHSSCAKCALYTSIVNYAGINAKLLPIMLVLYAQCFCYPLCSVLRMLA